VFTSERGGPFTTAGFARMLDKAGVEAKLGFKPHPHMQRHACGFALANKGHDTRVCRPISVTKTFSTLRTPNWRRPRFKDFLARLNVNGDEQKMPNIDRTSAGMQMVLPGCERRTLPKSSSRSDETGQGLLADSRRSSIWLQAHRSRAGG
jgi:hypothetical protein